MQRRLHFFTTRYPFGNSESFVHNELHSLSKAYDEIYIYPIKYNLSEQQEMRTLPDNVRVVIQSNLKYNLIKNILSNLFTFLFFVWKDIWFDTNWLKKIFNLKEYAGYFAFSVEISKQIKLNITNKDIYSTFYSFWMHESALALSILKYQGVIKEFIFRCHGFDVFNEVHTRGYILFRKVMYDFSSTILASSKAIQYYIEEKYTFVKDKIFLNYLGSKSDQQLQPSLNDSSQFVIVSCSNVIPLKRVELIFEVLNMVDLNIRWIHFGDGVSMNKLKSLVANKREGLNIELRGSVSNDKILKFYETTPVNIFLHFSSSEGLGIAMIEAISFGIPIMACDVGGVSEIVNENTGVLLPKDFEIQAVATRLEHFLLNTSQYGFSKASIRNYWKAHFDHTVNVAALINLLKS